MEKWQRILAHSLTDTEEIAKRFGLPADRLKQAAETFRFRVPPGYGSLIREKGDPIYLQCIPDERELQDDPSLMDDPLGEDAHAPVPNIVHRYPDRCLFLVSDQCAMYCRFCTRKRKFRRPVPVDRAHIDRGLDYIRTHEELHDVLVSGGDPFLLSDDRLEYILKNLHGIRHLDFIRIGTRTPCELTEASVRALGRLADAGIPLGCQTVLLKGVNDDPEVMRTLMRKLLAARVRPYYIHIPDLIRGTSHFRTPLSCALRIMDSLRGWTSGMAVPWCDIDLPHGGGKIPVVPDYLVKKEGNRLTFRNYRGDLYEYPDLPEDAPL